MSLTEAGPFLFDTNVISEMGKQRPDPQVMAFVGSLAPGSIFTSVLVIAELYRGTIQLESRNPEAGRRLRRWITAVERDMAEHTLDFDLASAKRWAEISADRSRPVVDTMLAATAIVHDLTLVTRNASDIEDLPVRWIDPWFA